MLNGNLTLGSGDTLVTDLANDTGHTFAGINGTVTSNGGLLRYRVTGQASATIAPVGPFATAGYELVDGAALTLTTPKTQVLPLILAGDGTVDLTAKITTTNASAILVQPAKPAPGTTPIAAPGLTITSHGTISMNRTSYFATAYGVVALGTNDAFINDGTINATYSATGDGDSSNPAIFYGASFTNNGKVQLDGAIATANVVSVINNGSIVQSGAGLSQGIVDASSIDNRGTIDVQGMAIQGYRTALAAVTNSGSITSRGDIAIDSAYSYTSITNQAGGSIAGGTGQPAIRLSSGSLVNAGTINGDVVFGEFGGQTSGDMVDNSGAINGNVMLGQQRRPIHATRRRIRHRNGRWRRWNGRLYSRFDWQRRDRRRATPQLREADAGREPARSHIRVRSALTRSNSMAAPWLLPPARPCRPKARQR